MTTSTISSSSRIVRRLAFGGLGLVMLGVSLVILVIPPHETAEADPLVDADLPTTLLCRTGGSMRLDVGPADHYLHFRVRPGIRPKTLDMIKPGECASDSVDIPLGAAIIPSLRFGTGQTGVPENVGFLYTVSATGQPSFSAVAQLRCPYGTPSCEPTAQDIAHANELTTLATALQTSKTLFTIGVGRDNARLMGATGSLRANDISFPQDNL